MKLLLLVSLLGGLAEGVFGVQDEQIKVPFTFELYSWMDKSGEWRFSLLPTTSRQKTPEEIFDEKGMIHTVAELRRRISRLAPKSNIVFISKIMWGKEVVKGTERLTLPPKKTIQEIKNIANSHKIRVLDVDKDSAGTPRAVTNPSTLPQRANNRRNLFERTANGSPVGETRDGWDVVWNCAVNVDCDSTWFWLENHGSKVAHLKRSGFARILETSRCPPLPRRLRSASE